MPRDCLQPLEVFQSPSYQSLLHNYFTLGTKSEKQFLLIGRLYVLTVCRPWDSIWLCPHLKTWNQWDKSGFLVNSYIYSPQPPDFARKDRHGLKRGWGYYFLWLLWIGDNLQAVEFSIQSRCPTSTNRMVLKNDINIFSSQGRQSGP